MQLFAMCAMRTRADAVRFAEAAMTSLEHLTFDEFCNAQPQTVREEHGDEELYDWFLKIADILGRRSKLTQAARPNRTEEVVLTGEWFVWSLSKEALRTSNTGNPLSLKSLFQWFDKDQSGTIDVIEFSHMCDYMGYGSVAFEIFMQILASSGGGHLQYPAFTQKASPFAVPSTANKLYAMSSSWIAHDERINRQEVPILNTTGWVLDATDVAQLSTSLRSYLAAARASVIDILASFNYQTSNRGDLTREQLIDSLEVHEGEFCRAIRERLGYRGSSDLLSSVFTSLDLDRSGFIGYDEIFRFILQRPNPLTRVQWRGAARERWRRELDGQLRSGWLKAQRDGAVPAHMRVSLRHRPADGEPNAGPDGKRDVMSSEEAGVGAAAASRPPPQESEETAQGGGEGGGDGEGGEGAGGGEGGEWSIEDVRQAIACGLASPSPSPLTLTSHRSPSPLTRAVILTLALALTSPSTLAFTLHLHPHPHPHLSPLTPLCAHRLSAT